MGSIQSLLAIGAIALFALISIRFNSSVLQNQTVEIENKVYLTAFSLADDLIEEIKQKAFDEFTVKMKVITEGSLTLPENFGVDSGEDATNHNTFDDIDDYDGYSVDINLPHAEDYEVISKITYCDSLGNDISTASFFKKITVTTSSPYMRTPVNLNFIFTLHSKLRI